MHPPASARLKRLAYFAGDLVLLNLAFLFGYWLRFGDTTLNADPASPYTVLLLVLNAAWLVLSLILNTYELPAVWTYRQQLWELLRLLLLHLLIVAVFWVFRKSYYYSRLQLGYTYLSMAVLLTAWRLLYLVLDRAYRRSGRALRNAIVMGQGHAVQALVDFFRQHPEHGYRVVQVLDTARVADVQTHTDQFPPGHPQHVDELFVTLRHLDDAQVLQLIEFADRNLIRLKLLPDFRGFEGQQLRIDLYGNLPVVAVRQYPLDDPWNASVKRGFDVVVSGLFLVLVGSWLFALLALLVRLSSPGPVFFLQLRHGRGGRTFWCYKFRTMRLNDEADVRQATRYDNRITPVGRILRRLNLDELPQLLNVLQGDMSIVGPRPHPVKLNEKFEPLIDKFALRHSVKPGLTGLAQATGHRGETPTVRHMRHRVTMDRFYVANWSIWLDLKIIFLTVANMVRGEENAV